MEFQSYNDYVPLDSEIIIDSYLPPTWQLYKEYVLPLPEHIIGIEVDFENIMYKTKCSYMWYEKNRNVIEIWAEEELSLYLAWHCIDMEVKKLEKFKVVKKIYSWADDVENASEDDFYISL